MSATKRLPSTVAEDVPPQASDALLAVALATISVTLQFAVGSTTRTTLGVVAGIAGAIPVLFRRTYPVRAFVAAFVAVFVVNALAPIDLAVTEFAVFYCFYSVMVQADRKVQLWATLLAVVALVSAPLWAAIRGASLVMPLVNFVIGTMLWITAWVLAALRRRRLRYTFELEDRTAALEDEVAHAAQAERARIARELHDVVAHGLGVITVQAGVGRHLAAAQPAQAEQALADIERVARDSLAEMRRIVGIMREPDTPFAEAAAGAPPPQPGLHHLDDLVEQVRGAGLEVEVSYVGEPTDIGAGIDLAAYRIVQESLTNARRHGGESAARVTLTYRPDGLDVEIVNDGGSGGAKEMVEVAGRGHGLVGMRERALVYGGSFEAGPLESGGFRVHAFLPFPQPSHSGGARA